jgi:hypothetical protein
MVVREESTQAQVERILHSETFRNSEVLRRLLRFLAEKSLAGEGDQLKEYTIGIDALGKPPSYDPRQDSVVRIQVGRLRQKLAEYYRKEGKDDPILIDLPKGRFKLIFEPRLVQAEPSPPQSEPLEIAVQRILESARGTAWRKAALALAVMLAVALGWASYATLQVLRANKAAAEFHALRSPELEALWKPLLSSNRPLIVSIAAPLFVGFQGAGLYRDLTLNNWEDVQHSPKVEALRKALKNPQIVPRYSYTGIGEVAAAFQLGKLLAVSPINVAMARSSQLQWQQLADNNVIFIGPPRLYHEQLRGLPFQLDILLEEGGIRVLHPRPGEPARLDDSYPNILGTQTPSVPDSGEVYAVITHTPGPLGSGDLISFCANHSPGTLGAVQGFTNPVLAKTLVEKLRKGDGELPRYYQLALKVTYKDLVPTNVSYVLHRELRINMPGSAGKGQ